MISIIITCKNRIDAIKATFVCIPRLSFLMVISIILTMPNYLINFLKYE